MAMSSAFLPMTSFSTISYGADNRTWTCTLSLQILNLACLPIPPYPHVLKNYNRKPLSFQAFFKINVQESFRLKLKHFIHFKTPFNWYWIKRQHHIYLYYWLHLLIACVKLIFVKYYNLNCSVWFALQLTGKSGESPAQPPLLCLTIDV